MSLEYYLICRKSYDMILQNLEDIINVYNEIDFGNIELSNNKQNLTFFNEKKDKVIQFKNICNQKIMQLCYHEFIEDTIDISPDKSQNIKYCSICEYTENK